MKNVTELRTELAGLFEQLRAGAIDVKVASEMNNTAGKIINSIKVELEYNKLSKNSNKIEFLEKPTEGGNPPEEDA